MKRIIVTIAAVSFLAGCATTEPIWFIATPGYVESRIATSEEATRRSYEAEIAQVQSELESQREVASELAAMADIIAEVEQNNRELLALADVLEDRLQNLPTETIRQLVIILQEHLDSDVGE